MQLRTDEETKEYTAKFESWSEFIDFCDKAPNLGFSNQSRGSSYDSAGFTQVESFKAAKQLALDGWPEGTKRVARVALKEFNAVSESIERPVYVYDIEGSDIDIARFIDGEPEVWLRREEHITQGPGRRIFHIVYNATVSGGVGIETIINRGAAACALVQALELAGNGVKLTVCMSACYKKAEVYVTVKEADQPLDLPRVAFALAHPCIDRRFMFAAQERLPFGREHMVGNGYSSPSESKEMGDIYFGAANYRDLNWNRQDEVTRWIKLTLEKQGIVLKQETA